MEETQPGSGRGEHEGRRQKRHNRITAEEITKRTFLFEDSTKEKDVGKQDRDAGKQRTSREGI